MSQIISGRRGTAVRNMMVGGLALSLVAALGGPSFTQAAPVPLIELTFQNGSLTNTGSLGGSASTFSIAGESGAVGEGISGNNQGFDNTSADDFGTADTDGAGGLTFAANPALENLTSYTVAGFYKVPVQGSAYNSTNARLLAGSGIDISYTFGRVVVSGQSTPPYSTRATWGAIDQWVFFAVTYNQGTYNLYGANASNHTVALLQTVSDGTTHTSGSDDITLANLSSGGIRPFDGLMDNLRLYGSQNAATSVALNLTDLQAIADQGFAEVPEPGSVALLGLGGFVLMSRRRGLA